ncbi:cell wall-associated proteinase PrtP [Lactobacillus kefiranofaciens subsp. kefiranofaciens DSM 5016 = JCM 6985]|nr:cell wall-associated proteinase PrtP [Lactobacillus kefiranofaciens subsp. kefiranofaciens DSM 5016 = JCM 6985]
MAWLVVSISASNDGNSAAVDATNNISDKDDYVPGLNAGNYQPFNSGTIGDPADSPDPITVAAEQSMQGEDSDMGEFTSWGLLPDYTLKPDVSAPGRDILSTGNDNQYVKMDGTSMAAPFNSGVAALVIQRLKKTNPNLHGAALVQAVKGLIMSTANPQLDINSDSNAIVSPRRQGAGQIDAGAATASPVYITTDDGTS